MQERIQVEDLRLEDLILDPDNPRKNDAAVPAVKESIKAFGFRVPIVIDKDNIIRAGNTRAKAAKELGLETVPCVRADSLTEKEIRAFQLADNKTGEFATWDNGLLIGELDSLLGSFDMSAFGFNLQGKEKGKSEKRQKDPQWVICPRCGNRIPRQQKIEWEVEDFEDGEENLEGDGEE